MCKLEFNTNHCCMSIYIVYLNDELIEVFASNDSQLFAPSNKLFLNIDIDCFINRSN